MIDLNEFHEQLIRQEDRRRQLKATAADEEKELAEIRSRLQAAVQAQQIFQSVAQAVQKSAHERITKIVTMCLRAVFEDPYEFKIEFTQKRGKTEAELMFERDGVEFSDPLNEVGGGVIDVAALALRLADVVLSKPACRKILVLDEPFKNIRGEANRARTKKMIERIAADLGVQILLNTDVETYRDLGTVVELG